MPELPEVEFTRRNLDRWMRGRRVVGVQTNDARIVRPSQPAAFVRGLTGRTIARVDRKGKWLRFTLDDGRYLFGHLGMTGWYEESQPGAPPRRFERVGFDLERRGKRSRVSYVDARRWGRLVLSRDEIASWTELGPDPYAEGIDLERFATDLGKRRRSIKEVLLDQSVLAGIGNIMAIEALWKARLDPRSPASALLPKDVEALAKGLRWTIDRTLAALLEGRDDGPDGDTATFEVYGHKGAPCPRCGRPLERIVLGGRTTTFCAGCQERRGRRTAATAKSRRGTAGTARPRASARGPKL